VTPPARRPPGSRSFSVFDLLSVTLAALFVFVLVYPLVEMFRRTIFAGGAVRGDTLVTALTDPVLGSTLLQTAAALGASGLAAVLIAIAFAWLNERTDAGMGWVSRLLPLVPLLLPPIALSTGWFFLAHSRAGSINIVIRALAGHLGITRWVDSGPLDIVTWQGLVFVYILYLVPFAYLLVAAAFRNIDPALEEASRASGAGHWRTFRRISLPAILPGIVASGLLVAISGLSSFSIPATIGAAARIDIVSVRIVNLVRDSYPPRYEEAAVTSLFVIVVVAGLWLLQRRISAGQRYSTIGGKGLRSSRIRLGVWKWPARTVMLAYLMATSVLPMLALMLVGMQRFWSPKIVWSQLSLDTIIGLFYGGSMMSRALVNSISLGVAGATLGMLLASVLMLYVRQRQGIFPRIADGATKAPGAIPNIVIGVALVIALSGPPFNLGGTVWLLLLAYMVVYMPRAAISAGSGIDQIGRELLEASAVTGATKGRTFRRIMLPLLRPSLAAGWALLFVVMVGDLTVSALIASGSNPVVGFVIYDIWTNATYSDLAALATVVGMISFTVVSIVLIFANPRFTGLSGQ
jgi:iron(III) transport system permease protein